MGILLTKAKALRDTAEELTRRVGNLSNAEERKAAALFTLIAMSQATSDAAGLTHTATLALLHLEAGVEVAYRAVAALAKAQAMMARASSGAAASWKESPGAQLDAYAEMIEQSAREVYAACYMFEGR